MKVHESGKERNKLTSVDILSKDRSRIVQWRKDLAPSNSLRKWFGHDPAKWAGFRERYRKELTESGEIDALRELAKRPRHDAITLIYSAAEEQHNQVVALKEFLDELA